MKSTSIKALILAALIALPAGNAFAESHTAPCYFGKSGKEIGIDKNCSLNFKTGSAVDSHGTVFSTTLTGNPLMQQSNGVLTLAQVNAGTTILAAASGRTIYPGSFTLLASGSASGATGVYLRCGGSNNVIASVPIAMLTTGTPVNPFKSAGAGGPVLASALTQGCAAGDSVYISTTGTLTTTTHLFYSLPYTVQ